MEPATVSLDDANEFIRKHHRHHPPLPVVKFVIGAQKRGKLVGVALVNVPVARAIDHKNVWEVVRCCTNGTKNACSWLYGRVAQAAGLLCVRAVITYTLTKEEGASLRAVGWWPEELPQRTSYDHGYNPTGPRGQHTPTELSLLEETEEKKPAPDDLGAKVRWLWLTGVEGPDAHS